MAYATDLKSVGISLGGSSPPPGTIFNNFTWSFIVKEIRITFQPSGRRVFVLPGTSLLEAAGRVGIILQTPCGGAGVCGKCKVKIISGEYTSAAIDKHVLSTDLLEQGFSLACQVKVLSDAVVDIPAESMFESRQQILVDDSGAEIEIMPVISKKYFELTPPESEDDRSDEIRLFDAIGHSVIPMDIMRQLPAFLRDNNWCGTAVLSGERIIALEQGDTSSQAYGIAFDIGTTTVVGTLFNLLTGEELGVVSRMNAQVVHGDDVISRIQKIREDTLALTELQQAIIETVNEIIKTLTINSTISHNFIYEIVIAGNATMQQIFCGLSPASLGEVPFVQAFSSSLVFPARSIGVLANPGADLFVMPQIGGFVGGDTVAGMIAARIDRWNKPVLLVDIGTNGEIVLFNDGKLYAASAAAGPAFEGARITQGMRATAGAIEKVLFVNGDVEINVIGNIAPTGLCGTALIDAVAEMLRAGIIDETGRILSREEVDESMSESLKARLVEQNGNVDFLLAGSVDSEPVFIYQKDIRELQLASGAIRAAINILLQQAGISADELGYVFLAGAFGNFIRRNNARRIGLLPQVACGAIRFIGNAASLGAKLALMSINERNYADTLCKSTQHVDLSLNPEFQMEFGMAMMFPDNDVDVCCDD